MAPLYRKLIRDLIHMRGQGIAITLVLACGITTYVTMRSSFSSLERAQSEYYSRYRFADVFAHVKRAPDSLSPSIASIPGIAALQTRVVMDVTLDVPGLEERLRDGLFRFQPARRRYSTTFLSEKAGMSRPGNTAKRSLAKPSHPLTV
jgi:putative ABC transport system permease protein